MLTIRHIFILKKKRRDCFMKYYVLKCMVDGVDYQEASFGVLMLNDDLSRNYICNVTTDYNKITELVNKMNEFHIEPCHTESVIEDFMYSMKTGAGT